MDERKLSASEALFGFVGWLTTRGLPVTFSSQHDACAGADLVARFCDANGLPMPEDGWEDLVVFPEE